MVLRIYLDTQDYAVLYKNRNQRQQRVYDFLMTNVADGRIEIGFSYPIISEFIQDYDTKYREDRIERAKLIKALCGKNAFKFYSRIRNEEAFSRSGDWIPDLGNVLSLDNLVAMLVEEIKDSHPTSSRKQRNALKNKRRLRNFVRGNMELFSSEIDYQELGLPVSRKFVEENMLVRFMAGELSRRLVEEEFLSIVTDIELFVSVWFEFGKRGNTLFESLKHVGRSLEHTTNQLCNLVDGIRMQNRRYRELEGRIRDEDQMNVFGPRLKQLRRNRTSVPTMDRNWLKGMVKSHEIIEFFPDSFWDSMACYLNQSIKMPDKFKESDFGDIMHSVYIPYCDLWRGDKDFCNTLIAGNIPGVEKIVPRLEDLPDGVDTLLRR